MGCLWDRCRDPRGWDHKSQLRPDLSYCHSLLTSFLLICIFRFVLIPTWIMVSEDKLVETWLVC